jgi:hypothetical protein
MIDKRRRILVQPQPFFRPAMRVLLIELDDFEVEAVLIYDAKWRVWLGLPDWSTRQDL